MPEAQARTLVLWVVAVLAVFWSCTATAAVSTSRPRLGGTWAGTYSGAYSGTFTLRWTETGSKLRGSITLSRPHGKYSTSGSVHGTAISFGAVGAGATYTGSVSGSSMSGRYKTGQGGGPLERAQALLRTRPRARRDVQTSSASAESTLASRG